MTNSCCKWAKLPPPKYSSTSVSSMAAVFRPRAKATSPRPRITADPQTAAKTAPAASRRVASNPALGRSSRKEGWRSALALKLDS
eukprot:CAMPEP_0197642608 /NCGR_PEP_ID=MMETSP1338-20131121/16216_1 /TAXON_ID=43686 ORGANISM="Pelagodinium beii, Strain RCC1491" /NCGR_SAMPLE_ID=MMETSP1338 /ASSEMBLY_ACC=CAM_ASM_000754 /LENGTH=84 /DNA_ID=CAMNT_0043215749 /DNA_START=522 /DNA_END=776 /DNA_ORIENTATION=+